MLLTLILFGSQIKSISAKRQEKVRDKNKKLGLTVIGILLLLYTGTLRMCGLQRYWYYIYDRDYHAKECGVPFSLRYYDFAASIPGNGTVYTPLCLQQSASCYA